MLDIQGKVVVASTEMCQATGSYLGFKMVAGWQQMVWIQEALVNDWHTY